MRERVGRTRREPPRRQHGFYVFHESRITGHETRTLWPFCSPWVRKDRTTKMCRPDRQTRHPVTAPLPGISQYFPLFPVSSRQKNCPRASVGAPSAVLGRTHNERLWLQGEPMLRKGKVLTCSNKGTLDTASRDNHVQERSAPTCDCLLRRIADACLIYCQQG